jgi:hypothetical protein
MTATEQRLCPRLSTDGGDTALLLPYPKEELAMSATILVLEDDEASGRLIRGRLEAAGHRVRYSRMQDPRLTKSTTACRLISVRST